MNPRLRTGIIVAVIGLGLIIVGIISVTSLFRGNRLDVSSGATPIPQVLVKAVITTHDLPLGTLLAEGDVAAIEIPVELAPRNTISDVDIAVGRITTSHLVKNELVLEHNLADPTNVNYDIAVVLPEDHILMAFYPGDLMSELSIIQRGDIIDIFVSIEQGIEVVETGTAGGLTQLEEELLITFDALQGVGVTAMVVEIIEEEEQGQAAFSTSTREEEDLTQNGPEPPKRETVNIKGYLLALDPQDALILKYLKDADGIFDLVLRNPNSTQIFTLNPVLEDYIKELYGLEALR